MNESKIELKKTPAEQNNQINPPETNQIIIKPKRNYQMIRNNPDKVKSIVADIAVGKSINEVAKNNGIGWELVNKIKNEKAEDIEKLKKSTASTYMKVSEKISLILQNQIEKLAKLWDKKNLTVSDVYRIVLSGKIAGDTCLMLRGELTPDVVINNVPSDKAGLMEYIKKPAIQAEDMQIVGGVVSGITTGGVEAEKIDSIKNIADNGAMLSEIEVEKTGTVKNPPPSEGAYSQAETEKEVTLT